MRRIRKKQLRNWAGFVLGFCSRVFIHGSLKKLILLTKDTDA